jgi:large subunit ribosomal protein L29
MEAEELRGMNPDELAQKGRELREEIFRLRLKRSTNQLDNPMKLSEIRRDLARIETILGEKRRAAKGS